MLNRKDKWDYKDCTWCEWLFFPKISWLEPILRGCTTCVGEHGHDKGMFLVGKLRLWLLPRMMRGNMFYGFGSLGRPESINCKADSLWHLKTRNAKRLDIDGKQRELWKDKFDCIVFYWCIWAVSGHGHVRRIVNPFSTMENDNHL